MSEDELPMMPFMVKDWIAATMHWPCAERGAYISFLAFQWVNKFLPAEDAQLARIGGIEPENFDHVWATVGQKFEADERGLFNIRLEEHRKKAMELRTARARGAETTNAGRRAMRDAQRVRFENAQRYAHATHPSTSPSSSSKNEEKEKSIEGRSALAERECERGTLSTDSTGLSARTGLSLCSVRRASPQVPGPGEEASGELLLSMPSVVREDSASPPQRAAPGAAAQEPGAQLFEDAGEARGADSAALREMPSDESGAPSSGLRRSVDGEMAVSRVPPAGAPHQRHSQKRTDELSTRFIEFKQTYPMRSGGHSWTSALKLWLKWCAKGYTPEQLIAGAERYALYCRATSIERTQFVMHARTFLGPETYFLQDWEIPAEASETRWQPPGDEIGADPP